MDSDNRLVQLALAGDADSFNLLVGKYQGAVYGLAYHLTGNFADAQDVTQDAFLLAYERLDQLREASRFPEWIRQIAANASRRLHRSVPQGTVSIDGPENRGLRDRLAHAAPDGEAVLEAKEREAATAHILALLPEKIRLTTTLFYIDDLSYRQISAFLGIPISTVKSRLYSARQRLTREALHMVAEVLGRESGQPGIEIKRTSGYLHVLSAGGGFLRRATDADDSPGDVFVSPETISMFQLKQGDHVEAHAKNPGPGEKHWSALRFEKINHEAAVSAAPEPESDRRPGQSAEFRRVEQLARDEAKRLRHGYIGTEHLLLGILKSGNGKTGSVLKDLGVEPHSFRTKIEEWVGTEPGSDLPGAPEFVPRATQALAAASNEAAALWGHSTEVEHLLLALTRDTNGVGARCLWREGIDFLSLSKRVARTGHKRTTSTARRSR